MALSWVVLDAMGVVFEDADDVDALLTPFIHERDPAVSDKHICAVYHLTSLGEITAARFWDAVGFGAHYPAVQQEYLDTRLRLDPACLDVMRRLQSHYKLAMLSNDVEEWSAHLRRRHGLDALLDTAVISGDVGIRKPDVRIYDALLQRIQAPAASCVFIDDRASNLRTAAALGFKTIHFARDPTVPTEPSHARIDAFSQMPDAIAAVGSR